MPLDLPQALQAPGFTRVHLLYTTEIPCTEAGIYLSGTLKVPKPYREAVDILVPSPRAFTILEAYLEPFERLRDAGVVPEDAALTKFDLRFDDDTNVLAYILE